MNDQDRHNRRVMLQRIKTYWLVGVLQESLHGAEIIDLSMAYRPSAVVTRQPQAAANVLSAAAWLPEVELDQPLPLGTPITDVYDEANGTLLIMGEPGAGKTTTLLQLVSALLQRAELEEAQPIPVVFGLASWQEGQGLGAWMVGELANNYEVPRTLGQRWLADGTLLPLLDGLDEVDAARREACAQAINDFRQKRPSLATVVTCRSQDYQALATDLLLARAVVLQPLSPAQIDQYLAGVGKRLAGLRAALQNDATLRELAQSPLMLSIMTLAYYRMPADVAITLGDREGSRKLLFDVYVERMARYRGGEQLYDPQDTIRWLGWLARQMAAHNQTMFFLENVQPDWLPRPQIRPFADKLRFTVGGLFLLIGLLAGGVGALLAGWPALAAGAAFGALTGALTTFGSLWPLRTPVRWRRIETVETIAWSWPWALLGSALGILGGLLLGGLLSLLLPGPPWMLVCAVLLASLLVLENALLPNEMKMRTEPGQGIARSRRNGRFVAGVTLVVVLALFGGALLLGRWLQIDLDGAALLPYALGTAVYLAFAGGLRSGGLAAWQHRRLLACLHAQGALPPDPVAFLNYAAERNLLRKVGGGYIFVHALLLDYFRQLEH